ncbi:MAG TPA: hypothetical protein VMI56_17130 [Reyranella sp.]|nr:hypothetical protein [Reyranella sp.]
MTFEQWRATRHESRPAEVNAFLTELLEVCRKHDMALGHEDVEGGFIVARGFSSSAAEWLLDASVEGCPPTNDRDWRVRK